MSPQKLQESNHNRRFSRERTEAVHTSFGKMSKESWTRVERIQQQRMDHDGEMMIVDGAGDPCQAYKAEVVKVIEVHIRRRCVNQKSEYISHWSCRTKS